MRYAYFLQRADGDVMIGTVTEWNLRNRLHSLTSQYGELKRLGVLPCRRDDVKRIQQRFSTYRRQSHKHGPYRIWWTSWFEPAEELMSFIEHNCQPWPRFSGWHGNRRATPQVVYFVQRSDGDIKIGCTSNLKQRLTGLKSEYGEVTLLATIPGDRETEDEIHKRFSTLRRQGSINPMWERRQMTEWFDPGGELISFIEGVRPSDLVEYIDEEGEQAS